MNRFGVDPFMHFGMAVGEAHSAAPIMKTGGQFGEDSGSTCFGRIDVKNFVVNAVRMFVNEDPT